MGIFFGIPSMRIVISFGVIKHGWEIPQKNGGLVRWGDAGGIIEPAMRDFQPAMELITSEYPLVI